MSRQRDKGPRRRLPPAWEGAPGQTYRPCVVTVMLEHMEHPPVWDRPEPRDGVAGDSFTAEELVALGVDAELLQELVEWNQSSSVRLLNPSALSEEPIDDEDVLRRGQQLALQLQSQLWDVEVRYFHHERKDLPVREQRPL